jgi:hypothetical protein
MAFFLGVFNVASSQKVASKKLLETPAQSSVF